MTNARTNKLPWQSMVNSSQLCLTEQSTRHTILGCDELTMWRGDWHPIFLILLCHLFRNHHAVSASGGYTPRQRGDWIWAPVSASKNVARGRRCSHRRDFILFRMREKRTTCARQNSLDCIDRDIATLQPCDNYVQYIKAHIITCYSFTDNIQYDNLLRTKNYNKNYTSVV